MTDGTQAYELASELDAPSDIRKCGRYFGRQYSAENLDEAFDDPLAWENWVLAVRLEMNAGRNRFLPVFEAGEDQERYPPAIEAMPIKSVDYFRQRVEETRYASLRTRYLEFLWERTGEFGYARRALEAYREAIGEGIREDAQAADLKRLAQWGFGMAVSLGEQEAAMRDVATGLIHHMADDPGGHFLQTVEASVPLLVEDDELVDDTLELLNRHIEKGLRTELLERGAMEAAVELASRAGRVEAASRFRAMIPESLEAQADWMDEEGAGGHAPLLQQALFWYRNLGDAEAVERVKEKLHRAGRATREDLERIPIEVSLDREEMEVRVEACLRETSEKPDWYHLQVFALQSTIWPEWEVVRQRREEWGEMSPFSPFADLMPLSLLEPDGRPVMIPEDPEEQEHYRDIFTYRWMLQWNLPQAELEVELLRERGAWTVDLVLSALASSPLFDEGDLDALRPGVRAYEEGRIWEAAHVLFPRIEAAVRRVAASLGVERHALDRETGELELKSLGELLKQEEIAGMLNRLRPDFCNELRYVLLHNWGLNLRHDLAHGVRRRDQVSSSAPLLFLLVLVALSALPEDALDETEEGRG